MKLPIWLSKEKLTFHWIANYPIDTEYPVATYIKWYDFDERYDVYCIRYNCYKKWNAYEARNSVENIYSFNFWIKVRRSTTEDIIDVCRITDINKGYSMDTRKNITILLRDGNVKFDYEE